MNLRPLLFLLLITGCGFAKPLNFTPSKASQAPGNLPGTDGTGPGPGGGGEETQQETTPLLEELPPFPVGYNVGWVDSEYGTDLTTNYSLPRIEETLAAAHDAGADIIRLWLLENREGMVLNPFVPQSGGLDPAFVKHVKEILHAARKHRVHVYLALFNGNDMKDATGAAREYYSNLLNNRYGEHDSFNVTSLTPLLRAFEEYKDVIFGLDLMNEIEAPMQAQMFTNNSTGPRNWIKRAATYVKKNAPWLRVTASAGGPNAVTDLTSGMFSGLGLDFYDLHSYSDLGTITGSVKLCQKVKTDALPIILGEFGQKSLKLDDTLQAIVTAAFLKLARAACFSGALAWRFHFDPDNGWGFIRRDGSFRPAVTVIRSFPRR